MTKKLYKATHLTASTEIVTSLSLIYAAGDYYIKLNMPYTKAT